MKNKRLWVIGAMIGLAAVLVTWMQVMAQPKEPPPKHTCACPACTKLVTPAGRVAIVDLDSVASQMGWADKVNMAMSGDRKEFESALERLDKAMKEKLNEKKREFAARQGLNADQTTKLLEAMNVSDWSKLGLTPEQVEELVKMGSNASLQFQAYRKDFSDQWVRRRSERLQRYRDYIKPVVEQYATANAFAVVLVNSDAVFYRDNATDITEKIVNVMKNGSTKYEDPKLPPIKIEESTTRPSETP